MQIYFYIYLINVRAHLKLSQIKLFKKKSYLNAKLIRIECVCGVEERRCNSERASDKTLIQFVYHLQTETDMEMEMDMNMNMESGSMSHKSTSILKY